MVETNLINNALAVYLEDYLEEYRASGVTKGTGEG